MAGETTHGARRFESDGLPTEHSQSIAFWFNGQKMAGRLGEPVAAALIASGVRVFRTMPDTGEARGGFCFVGRCSDCMVTIDGRQRVRSCVTPLFDGMRVETEPS